MSVTLYKRILLIIAFLSVLLMYNPVYAKNSLQSSDCNFTSGLNISAQQILQRKYIPQCGITNNAQPIIWSYFRNLNIVNNSNDPLDFRMTLHERADQSLFVKYKDGQIEKSPSDINSSALYYSWGEIAYKLPIDDRPIAEIIVRSTYSQNSHAAAPGAQIISQSNGAKNDVQALATYLFMAGVILVLFQISIILYLITRRTFLLVYNVSLTMVLLSGIFWSGAMNYFAPNMSIGDQKEISALTMVFYGMCQILLMMTTFEEEYRHKRIEKILLSSGFVAAIGQVFAILAPSFHWQIINNITLIALAILVVGLYCCALASARKGSMVAKLYTYVWAVPFIVASIRIAWGFEIFTGFDKLILVSPLFMLFGEVLLGAFVMGWLVNNLQKLRNDRDIAILREASLIKLSETDGLTGLLNRRAFLSKTSIESHVKTLILIDIDNFKAINDTHGHVIGDDVIQYVAQCMRDIAPKNAHLGRLGGEEFAILLIGDDNYTLAQSLCNMIAESVHETRPKITISCGLSVGEINNEKDWRAQYIEADKALYFAKNNGRNQIHPSQKISNNPSPHAITA